jgi:glutamate:GABA antiporter
MKKPPLSVFMLAMMNVAAIGSVKNWPQIAEYGLPSIFFLILAALVFFIPVSLVSAELSTAWPETGGVFIWVKEAFGPELGFVAIWLLWISNVIWYPTCLSFTASTIAYTFDPGLQESRAYMVMVSVLIISVATWVNLKGMRVTGWVITICVILGTFIPAAWIICQGIAWYGCGKLSATQWELSHIIPKVSTFADLAFFTGVILSFCGIEVSAFHAKEVVSPQKNYPRAIFLSLLLILAFTILGVLSILIILPKENLSLTAGVMQVMSLFLNQAKLKSFVPLLAGLTAIGTIGTLSTWMVGPSRGLLASMVSGSFPPLFKRINKNGMPHFLLILQLILVSLLSLLFLFMPSVSGAYWILVVLVTQVYLLMYLILFASFIRLRYKRPEVVRPFRVPGGSVGMWAVALLGGSASLFSFFIGFFPPPSLSSGNPKFFISFLGTGILISGLLPLLLLSLERRVRLNFQNLIIDHTSEMDRKEENLKFQNRPRA